MKFSREECIEEMQMLSAGLDTTLTRNKFREVSNIPETNWIFWFGTFAEFKKASGLEPTDQEAKFVANIAKKSSVFDIQKINQEKISWSLDFLKKSFAKYQTFVIFSDIHDEMCDPFFRRMAIQSIKDTSPTKIILNGDIFDMLEFSSYSKKIGDIRIRQRHKWVMNFLEDCRIEAPQAEINMIEGNHEYRLISYLAGQSPMIMELLDLHGWQVRDFFGLSKYQVNYYSRADLGTFNESHIQNELKKNYYKFEDIVLFHHFPQGKMFGMPGCSGHHHAFKAWNCFNATYGSYNWYQTGGGVRRHVDYEIKMGEAWTNGFMMVHIDLYDKRNTVFEYVDCTNDFCILNGKRYVRTSKEKLYVA